MRVRTCRARHEILSVPAGDLTQAFNVLRDNLKLPEVSLHNL